MLDKKQKEKKLSYARLLFVYDIQYNLYKYLLLLYLIEKNSGGAILNGLDGNKHLAILPQDILEELGNFK